MIKAVVEKSGEIVEQLTPLILPVVERNLVPDFILRFGTIALIVARNLNFFVTSVFLM